MAMNIACFVPGCTQPVIGQCAGYNENCGRFYCSQHSSDRLCADHAAKKGDEEGRIADEAAAERIKNDYIQTAKEYQRQTRDWTWVWGLYCIGSFILCGLTPNYQFIQIIIFVVVSITALVYSILRGASNHDKLEKLDAVKPGFKQFYKEWRKQVNKEAMGTTLAVVLGAIAVGIALAGDTDDKRRIQREVDKELDRRGYK
jgi:hypothetical protein